jgi:hypothetical protein
VIGYDAYQAQVARDCADRAERAAMARELTAARKVIEQARSHAHPLAVCDLAKALAAYDAAVGKGDQ